MTDAPPKTLRVFAPAKINLFLHVTGKRNDGYHALDSLITFADIGDNVILSPRQGLAFEIEGPMAARFDAREKTPMPDSQNLVIRALWSLARMTNRSPSFTVTLEKYLPLGAGLGGGSADAAAVLWALCRYWDIAPDMNILRDLMMQLGADVPVCFESQTRFISGAGENLGTPVILPEMYAVIIYPGTKCNTKAIFKNYGGGFDVHLDRPTRFNDQDALISFLKTTQNSLTSAALRVVPEIQNCLTQLEDSEDCLLARMSGSGSASFGLYRTRDHAEAAAKAIKETNPDWWVEAATLGQAARY